MYMYMCMYMHMCMYMLYMYVRWHRCGAATRQNPREMSHQSRDKQVKTAQESSLMCVCLMTHEHESCHSQSESRHTTDAHHTVSLSLKCQVTSASHVT